MTIHRINSGFFYRRLNGLRHPSVPNYTATVACQYCHYQWRQLEDKKDTRKAFANLKQNRYGQIRRCMVCNVNLCSFCENEFHGIRMTDTAAMMGMR